MTTPSPFRFGYTLIELLISVTLSLFLLIGVTEMFRQVGSTMSDTQKSLNMSANLNGTAMQLRKDLGGIDPALAHQPYNMSKSGYTGDVAGFLEINEGMNAPVTDINMGGTDPLTGQPHQPGTHFPISFIAKNSQAGGTPDQTVGDVDDIIAFTTKANVAYPFRGLMNNEMKESNYAEIIWFLRGNNLYRRIFLLDGNKQCTITNPFYSDNDVSVRLEGAAIKTNEESDLVRRENRFAHYNGGAAAFPYPLYNSTNTHWYSLRMPTLEETVSTATNWQIGQQLPTILPPGLTPIIPPPIFPYWDFWDEEYNEGAPNGPVNTPAGILTLNKKTGSLLNYVNNHPRAGEDLILRNVISFDVKVWNPYWVPCVPLGTIPTNTNSIMWAPPQYIDLGQDRFHDNTGNEYAVNYLQSLASTSIPTGVPSGDVGYGFTLKGRYNKIQDTTNTRRKITPDDDWRKKELLGNGSGGTIIWSGEPMPCVFDSWTRLYETTDARGTGHIANTTDPIETWSCPPPYSEDLQSIQITIRCFEPQSGNIKQVRVVHQF